MSELCHCGKPLHYTSMLMQAWVLSQIDRKGPTVPVTDSAGRTWIVPRHFIALHGLKEQEVSLLGFARAPEEPAP